MPVQALVPVLAQALMREQSSRAPAAGTARCTLRPAHAQATHSHSPLCPKSNSALVCSPVLLSITPHAQRDTHLSASLLFECPSLQGLRDKYENLFQAPQGGAMILFMWQDDMTGFAHFIDACLERVYTSAGPPVGYQVSDQPRGNDVFIPPLGSSCTATCEQFSTAL